MSNVEKVLEATLVNAAKTVEKEVDTEIDRLTNLQEDDLEAIRRRRLAQLKKAAEERAIWKRNGHGTLHTLTEKDFFTRAKGVSRMVVVFFQPGTSRYSSDLIEHVAKLAEHHLETLFATIDANKAPFLCQRLKIRVLPSLLFLKDGEIDQVLVGLDALSQTGKFTTKGIEKRLFEFQMLMDTNLSDND